MYAELVKRLREAPNDWPDADLHYEAADAIEELQKVANKLLAKYQEEATSVIWERSGHICESLDRLNEEVGTLIAQIKGEITEEEANKQYNKAYAEKFCNAHHFL